MITREQYLNALEVIDRYHRQQSERMTIVQFFKEITDRKQHYVSGRLANILLDNFVYLDEVSDFALAKCRNSGKGTIEEFNKLKKSL